MLYLTGTSDDEDLESWVQRMKSTWNAGSWLHSSGKRLGLVSLGRVIKQLVTGVYRAKRQGQDGLKSTGQFGKKFPDALAYFS
jgi:hypothetical protein